MDFSFNLTNGDKAVIIGEEGNGKSTLLKLIYDRKLVESYCEWDGKIISKSKLAYLPQMIDESISDMTLSEYFENTEYYLYTDILTKLGITLDFILSDQKFTRIFYSRECIIWSVFSFSCFCYCENCYIILFFMQFICAVFYSRFSAFPAQRTKSAPGIRPVRTNCRKSGRSHFFEGDAPEADLDS